MRNRILAVAAGLALVGGCATVPNRCPVVGERASLAGMWDGEFVSTNSERRGTIHFELQAGQDSAYGDVIIVPEQWLNAARIAGEQRAPGVKMPEVIRVSFVYVADNHVRGMLDDYVDPICDCTLKTVFDGERSGNTIKGTYETRQARGGIVSAGTWTVRRISSELHARIDSRDALH